jgi:hypothetical protein
MCASRLTGYPDPDRIENCRLPRRESLAVHCERSAAIEKDSYQLSAISDQLSATKLDRHAALAAKGKSSRRRI